jgi:hypothetical protein
MNVGGYRKATDPFSALVVNKGSLGREEKLITFLDTDEEELLKYLRGERTKYDPLGRTQLADLDIVSISKGSGLATSQGRERGKSATKRYDSIEHEDAELGGREPPLLQWCCQRKEPDGICDAVDG